MKRNAITKALLVLTLALLASCSYNPFIAGNNTTGNPIGALVGAGVGAGGAALVGAPKPYIGLAGLAGGAIGYYVTTLRYASGSIIQIGGQVYKVGDIVGIYLPSDKLFDSNTADFLPGAKTVLNSVADVLDRYPNNNVIISGNTSGFYRARWEQRLSERRAQKVSAYLWFAGINNFKGVGLDTRRLNYVGYGDYFPISTTENNEGLRSNSRIQIISYPSTCDLGIDKRSIALRNMGSAFNDLDIATAPR